MDTKLILIEGFPGAGKTTSTTHLGKYLQQQRIACRWYLEEDDPHPIDCLKLKLADLSEKLPPLWRAFVEQALRDNIVTIIESRLWQNTALFMFMSEFPVDEIIEVHQFVWKELAPLSPTLVFLYQDDIAMALNRLYTLRDKDLIAKDIQATSQYPWFQVRGLNNFEGWVQFFKEWQTVADQLYSDWPYRKMKIKNPHDNWDMAYQQIFRLLQGLQHTCVIDSYTN